MCKRSGTGHVLATRRRNRPGMQTPTRESTDGHRNSPVLVGRTSRQFCWCFSGTPAAVRRVTTEIQRLVERMPKSAGSKSPDKLEQVSSRGAIRGRAFGSHRNVDRGHASRRERQAVGPSPIILSPNGPGSTDPGFGGSLADDGSSANWAAASGWPATASCRAGNDG